MKFKLVEDTGELSNEYDSEGNQLTKSQAEFFKNSKVRDESGRLLVCYHGSDSEFDVFDNAKIIKEPGFWFATNKSYVSQYGKKTNAYYLNIDNPIDIDGMWELAKKIYGKNVSEDDLKTKEFRHLMIRNKFSGVIYDEDDYTSVIIAFEPNQIKSITNKEPSNSDNINEDLWSKKVYKGTRWNGEPYEDTQEIYTPKKDSKYQRLLRKPINQLTYEEIKYIYVVHVCWYMQQIWQFNTIKDAYDRIIDSDIEKSLKECYEFVHNLSFPLTIYRAIRESEFKDGVFNISGKKSSLSWSTNLEIYKNERSIFKNAGNIVSCNIDSNIVDNANTINNFIHYTASDKTKQHYGEYEITLKDNFKTSDLHDLHWVDKDGNGYYNKFKL